MDLAEACYVLTKRFPKYELFGMTAPTCPTADLPICPTADLPTADLPTCPPAYPPSSPARLSYGSPYI